MNLEAGGMGDGGRGTVPTRAENPPVAEIPTSDSRPPTPFQLAIDGPAGAGKSTVARGVADALGITYIDTGAMYRAVGLKVARMSGPDAEPDWGAVAHGAYLEFQSGEGGQRIALDGEDVEDQIRTPEMSEWASRVSTNPAVRRAVTDKTRRMARRLSVVMEGRDIGTVVLPSAPLKIFLTAPEAERARRRAADLEAAGKLVSASELRKEIRDRDTRDETREDAPLKKADDAVEINTAGLNAEQVIAKIVGLARDRGC